MYVHYKHAVPTEARREHWIPLELELALHRCWELNLGPPQEQTLFFTKRQSLQLFSLFSYTTEDSLPRAGTTPSELDHPTPITNQELSHRLA